MQRIKVLKIYHFFRIQAHDQKKSIECTKVHICDLDCIYFFMNVKKYASFYHSLYLT